METMYIDFLNFLQSTNQDFFIEAEARKDKMLKFINRYNNDYNENVSLQSNGICLLGDVDKWGVELRIYFNDKSNIPSPWDNRKYVLRHYRSDEFTYRLDDNDLVYFLFDNGYRIGYN